MSATAAYGVYSSPTFDGAATVQDVGGGEEVTNLCLSCHDGTVAPTSMYNVSNGATVTAMSNITGSANIGTDLSNDHPVNFDYDNALFLADGELRDPSTLTDTPLFNGTVQCASCHDAHDDSNTAFLVIDNQGSALCLECHVK
jgi:predicted CXXCH cytochrome family protein